MREQVQEAGTSGRGKAAILAAAGLALGACDREERTLRLDPPVVQALNEVATMPSGVGGAPPLVYVALGKPFENNAYELSQGKLLFAAMGCKACHGDGLGGRGPSLIDGWWRYGSDPVSLFVSIRDGRPAGMPAYADRLPPDQIWRLAGYVQALGSYTPRTAAPGRNDEPQTRPAENRAPAASAPPEPPRR